MRLRQLQPWLKLATLCAGLLPAGCVPADPPLTGGYKAQAGPGAVRQETGLWYDAQRLRYLSVRLYVPEECPGPLPLIVFSHGLGASGDQYTHLGTHWASHGYLVVYPTHSGSDTEAIFNNGPLISTLRNFASDPPRWRERPEDVAFILDHLEQDAVWAPLIDFERVGVAGHSFGAYTAMAMIGMRIYLPGTSGVQFTDARVKAIVALSPLGPGSLGLRTDSWDQLAAPCMSLTGTLDVDPSTLDPEDRRAAFEASPASDQYLITFSGATHSSFDDRATLPGDRRAYLRYHHFVQMATIAFFDAYLSADATAQDWLLSGTLGDLSGGDAVLEYRDVTPLDEQP